MKLTPEKMPDMQNFSVTFDICTDDKNSRSAKQEKEATGESYLQWCSGYHV